MSGANPTRRLALQVLWSESDFATICMSTFRSSRSQRGKVDFPMKWPWADVGVNVVGISLVIVIGALIWAAGAFLDSLNAPLARSRLERPS